MGLLVVLVQPTLAWNEPKPDGSALFGTYGIPLAVSVRVACAIAHPLYPHTDHPQWLLSRGQVS